MTKDCVNQHKAMAMGKGVKAYAKGGAVKGFKKAKDNDGDGLKKGGAVKKKNAKSKK